MTEITYTDGLLTVPYPPSGNRYYRKFRNHMVKSPAARQYTKDIATSCLEFGLEPLTGEVKLSIDLYRPQKSGDLDNFGKILRDALQGILYVNDKQIVEIHDRRFDDKAKPRAEIRVIQLSPK